MEDKIRAVWKTSPSQFAMKKNLITVIIATVLKW